jgi:hypothetical protein
MRENFAGVISIYGQPIYAIPLKVWALKNISVEGINKQVRD